MLTLKDITKVSEFVDMLEWRLDEHGLVITDFDLLVDTIAREFPELEDDMPQKETN